MRHSPEHVPAGERRKSASNVAVFALFAEFKLYGKTGVQLSAGVIMFALC